jgi:hypothetical protein
VRAAAWLVLGVVLAAAPPSGAQQFEEPAPLPPFPLALKLDDGREIRVDELTRKDDRVRFREATTGARRQVAAARVVSPPLASIPVILTLSDGRELTVTGLHRAGNLVRFREVTTNARRQAPASQVVSPVVASLPVAGAPQTASAAPPVTAPATPPVAPPVAPSPVPAAPATAAFQEPPPLPPFPLTLRLADGREIQVDELTRKDGRVRFREARTAARRQVAEDRVVAPALESIPQVLTLADGREITVVGLHRDGDRIRFREVTTGQRRQVAATQLASPPLATLPTAGAPATPPTGVATADVPPVTPAPVPTAAAPAPGAAALADFEVMPDRWAILDDLMEPLSKADLATWRAVRGSRADPYNQNTLKGDRPIAGNSTFLVLTASLDALSESRRVPLPSGASAENPGSLEFFGNGNQLFTTPRGLFSLELFKGQTVFRPKTWAVKVTAAVNENYLRTNERNAVNIDPREGTTRSRQDFSLEEAFAEVKIADLSAYYDTVSVRAGIQPFVSDFRGFIFSDFNLGARLFGNAANNRWQYNLAYFDLLEKETNSELNTFEPREQKVFIANLFRQDFLTRGYTLSLSYHRSQDEASEKEHFDANDFPVRPARIGTPRLHDVVSNYAGWTGDGHIGRLNISHALYFAFGEDEDHPLGDRESGTAAQDIGAAMGALEISIDKDWARFKGSAFFASGDDDIDDGKAKGFDTIYDFTNFAGGPFSFWNRSGIPLTQTAVFLKGPGSLLPSLRSNKFEGQANFVNPGLLLVNAGLDLELTPKLKAIVNANYLRFHKTGALQSLLFQPGIRKTIGIDVGGGFLYRPLLNENVVIQAGVTALLPGAAFDDLFSSPCSQPSCGAAARTLYNGFLALKLTY